MRNCRRRKRNLRLKLLLPRPTRSTNLRRLKGSRLKSRQQLMRRLRSQLNPKLKRPSRRRLRKSSYVRRLRLSLRRLWRLR